MNDQQGQKAQIDYTFKYIMVGSSSVGKSSLIQQFVNGNMNESYEVTIGQEIYNKIIKINDSYVKLQIWDTAGQENFKSITKGYYKTAAGVILTYDISSEKSFEESKGWMQEVKDNCPKQIQVALAGNKNDKSEDRQVEFDSGQELANIEDLIFYETSARSGENKNEIEAVQEYGITPKNSQNYNAQLITPNPENSVKNAQNSKKCC